MELHQTLAGLSTQFMGGGETMKIAMTATVYPAVQITKMQ
jgi:hypothetical protein